MRFSEAIAPMALETFLDSHLDKQWIVFPGSADRFESFVTWEALNAVLSGFRMPPGSSRLRLVKDGKPMAADTWLRKETKWGAYPRAGAFERHLADGATLVLDGVDEFFPEVRELAEDTEQVLSRFAWSNLYIGWRSQGFDLHWDDHDTVVVQVRGRKSWTVYGPTCEYPTKDFEGSWMKPQAPPVWEGVLNAGEILYMPRGWWHFAKPLGGASVHVTIGLRALSGGDVLSWLASRLTAKEVFRMNVPLFAGVSRQAEYISDFRKTLVSLLTDDCLNGIVRHANASLFRRTTIDVANSMVERPAIRASSIVLLSDSRALNISRVPAGNLRIVTGEFVNECSPRLQEPLSRLTSVAGSRFEELSANLDPALVLELKILLTTFCLQGTVLVRDEL